MTALAAPTAGEFDAPPAVVPAGTGARPGARRAALTWLAVLLGFVAAMIVIGGATRLTGSGLSITEWRPVTGAIPPLSAADWAAEFDRYRASPQYRLMNAGMSLGDFRFIYWWEWGHRQLGRVTGLVGALGLAGLWVAGALRGRALLAGLGLVLLLGAQGAVGWIMVASGLREGMTAVAPVKLALHLTLALLLLAGALRLALSLRAPGRPGDGTPGLVRAGRALVALVLAQVVLGALVAGSRAGLAYNTWPLMDGGFAPPLASLLAAPTLAENLLGNPALVQLNHRLGAYLLLAAAAWHALAARRAAGGWIGPARRAAGLLGLVLAQAAFGVVTLLLAVPLWAGLLHQAGAALLLAAAVAHAARLSGNGALLGAAPFAVPAGASGGGAPLSSGPISVRD